MRHGPVIVQDRGTLQAKFMANPELTLPAVAACIPPKHNIRIIHENYEDIDYSTKYDLVGISCFTMFAPQVYEIADKFRRLGVPVVLGGYHPTALPEEAKQHADSVVIGEAEESLPQLITDLEAGTLQPFYKANHLVPAKKIPPLRRDLLIFHPITDGIGITRGCKHHCNFCSITSFYHHTYRERQIEDVIKEIKGLDRRVFLIHDANFTMDLNYTTNLLNAMIKAGIRKKWLANGNINVLGENDDFLRLAHQAGCICWTIGFESISQECLDESQKKTNQVDRYPEYISAIRRHHMAINGLFMFGFDHDTPEIFDATIRELNSLEIDAGEFNIITPLPGTPLYTKMEKEKRILTRDWGKYTQTQVVFKPKCMTNDELYFGTRKVVKSFYATRTMHKRWFRLLKLSRDPILLSTVVTMDQSRRIWYRREFDI
jgi:radical SAM superfamily enzyme YgiQ (UPF0313 family)